MCLLRLDNVVKRFSDVWHLDIDSFSVNPGNVYAIYGPNGSGKSTLLNIMALLLTPDSGRVCLNGDEVNFSDRDLYKLRRNVTMVMQRGYLFNGTVTENVEYGLKCQKLLNREKIVKVKEILNRLGLSPLEKKDVRTLSGGEVQRVMLARALVLDVDLLLLDEVMSGIDEEYRGIVESVVSHYVDDQKKSVVMTTHDVVGAHRLANHVIFIENGRLSEMPMLNVFPGTLCLNGTDKYVNCGGRKIFVTDGEKGSVKVVVSPRDIIISKAPLASSARNSFAGKISSIHEVGGHIDLLVDANPKFKVWITKKSQENLSLNITDEVFLSFKASSVKVHPVRV